MPTAPAAHRRIMTGRNTHASANHDSVDFVSAVDRYHTFRFRWSSSPAWYTLYFHVFFFESSSGAERASSQKSMTVDEQREC